MLFIFNQMIAKDTIEIYNCYGNDKRVIVQARVLDAHKFTEAKKDDDIFTNLKRKLGIIFNDERENVNITIEINGEKFERKSDDEGYLEFDLSFEKKALKPNQKIDLYLTNYKEIENSCNLFIPSDKRQTGIISDFDDTIIISNVTNKLSLLNQLLLKNYKQREVIKGMKRRFEEILRNSPDKPLFIITGSVKQFNKVIRLFLDYHKFPKRTIITKKIHGKNSNSIFEQKDYKSENIEKLLRLYPNIEWVLFGDSGEEDRQIYLNIAKKYPSHIKEIYIREIKKERISKIYPK